MTFQEIQDLIKLISKSKLTEFKMKDGDFKLSVRTKDYRKKQQAKEVMQPQPQVMQIPTPMPQVSTPAPAPAQAAPTPDLASAKKTEPEEQAENANLIEVRSPIVGTFYRSSSPEKPPYVKVGDIVEVGSTVCIVEAMKLFNEIESEVSGKVYKVMVEDASPVEYDQVLFLLEPA